MKDTRTRQSDGSRHLEPLRIGRVGRRSLRGGFGPPGPLSRVEPRL